MQQRGLLLNTPTDSENSLPSMNFKPHSSHNTGPKGLNNTLQMANESPREEGGGSSIALESMGGSSSNNNNLMGTYKAELNRTDDTPSRNNLTSSYDV